MINLIDGRLNNSQENIYWAENKSSATVILNTHSWKKGDIFIVGYKTENGEKDIIIGIGIDTGVGPSFYRIIIERSMVVVSEVLDYTPDVSYYIFDQIYLVKGSDGNLKFTRKFLDPSTDEILIESKEANNKCVIIESSTNDIWICSPPKLVNLFELSTKPSIDNIIETEDGQITIDLVSGNGKVWKDLCFIDKEEKSYLSETIFLKNFEVSIVGQKFDNTGKLVLSNDPCIVSKTTYYLVSKYSGELMDLDEIPEGWGRDSIGVYTKDVYGNISSSSGKVNCSLTISGYTGTKITEEVLVNIDKCIFIIYSPTEFSNIDGADKVILSPTSKLGRITITPPQNYYTWFAFPTSLTQPDITQIGIRYVSGDTKIIPSVIKSGANLGNYIIYRSLNPGNGEEQQIMIE